MIDPVIAKIQSHPKYAQLRKQRNTFGWLLTVLTLVVYYGFIALIAFNKPFLAQPLQCSDYIQPAHSLLCLR